MKRDVAAAVVWALIVAGGIVVPAWWVALSHTIEPTNSLALAVWVGLLGGISTCYPACPALPKSIRQKVDRVWDPAASYSPDMTALPYEVHTPRLLPVAVMAHIPEARADVLTTPLGMARVGRLRPGRAGEVLLPCFAVEGAVVGACRAGPPAKRAAFEEEFFRPLGADRNAVSCGGPSRRS